MKRNVGLPDRIIRIVLATIAPILYLADIINGVVAMVLLSISCILLITSFIRFCPLYAPFGLNTNKKLKQ